MRITTRRSARAAWWHYYSCFFSLLCVVKNNNVFRCQSAKKSKKWQKKLLAFYFQKTEEETKHLIKKKRASETHENESWEFETLNRNQLCTRAWHVITSLSPPRARVDWGPRARERCWKARGCTHTPHKSFAGTQSGRIRAFYRVSLSVYFLRRKKRKNRGKIGGERKRKRKRKRKR